MTVLAPSGLAILGFNTTGEESDFSFVLLSAVEAGTEIYFTDTGTRDGSTAFGNTNAADGTLLWTAPTDYAAGTVINYFTNLGDFTQPLIVGIGGTVQPIDLRVGGDQLIAFQGDLVDNEIQNPTFIYAVNTYRDTFQGSGDGREGDTSSVNQSGVPAGLTEGETALALGEATTNVDSVLYTGPTIGTRAELLTALADVSNWSTDAGTTQTQITASFTVTDAVTNADPDLMLPGPVTLDEDAVEAITGITVSDLEGDEVTLDLTAAATLNVTASGAAIVTGSGSGSMTIVGSVADVNATVASLTLTPPQDSTDAITLRVVASDKDGTSNSGTVAITVTPVDDTAQIEFVASAESPTPAAEIRNGELAATPLAFGTSFIVVDPDVPSDSLGDFDLIISYGASGSDVADLLAVATTLAPVSGGTALEGISTEVNTGTGATEIFVTENGGAPILIGTVDLVEDGTGGNDLRITLASDAPIFPGSTFLETRATPDRITVLLEALRFSNPAASPGTRDLTLQLSREVTPGVFETSDLDTFAVTIIEGNVAPVLTDLAPSITFDPTVVGTPQVVDANVTLTDTDSTDFNGGSLTIAFSAFRPGASTVGEELSFDVSGPFSILGSDLSFSGTVIGTISSDGIDGNALIVDFTSATATPAVVEQLIEALRYRNTATTPETTREVQITVDDGDGATSVAQTVAFVIETIAPPDRSVTYVEQSGNVLIDDLQQFTADGADGDQTVYAGGTLDITMTGPAASDGLTFPSSTTGVSDGDVLILATGMLVLRESFATGGYVRIGTVTGDGTRSLTITFETTDGTFFNSGVFAGFSRRPTADEVEKVVQTLQYTNSEGDIPTEGTRTVELVLTDAALTVEPTETFTVEVVAVEDAPVLSAIAANIALDYSGGVPGTPATFNGTFDVADVDTTNFAGGEFRVAARTATAEDNFSILDGSGITVTGDQVSFGGSVIGTVSGGTAGNDLVVTLSGTVSEAAVEALGLQVAYLNTSATPQPIRSIAYSLSDGEGGESVLTPQTLSITGGATLQPPAIADIDTTVTPLASALVAGPVVLDADITLSDADMSGFDGGSLLLSYQGPRGATTDQLSILSGSGGVGIEVSGTTVSFDGTAFGAIGLNGVDGESLEISLYGPAATGTAVEALIEALQYQSSATVPTGEAGLTLTVTDADGQVSNEVALSVEILDDGISVGDTAVTREDTDLIVSFAQLLSNDANFGDAVTITSVQDAVGGTVQIVGSNVVFTPAPDTNGPASFSYTAGDGVWTSTATVSATVTPVNDAPVETGVSGDVSTTLAAGAGAQALTGLTDATLTDIDSADFDGGFVRIAQTAGAANGTFGLGAGVTSGGDSAFSSGETVSVGGTAIGTVSGSGATGAPLQVDLAATATPALLETFLRSLTYDIPTAVETRNFLLTVDDGDGTADGGASAVTAAFAVQVTPSAPVITGLDGDTLAYTEADGPRTLDQGTAASVTDLDSATLPGGSLTVSFQGGGTADETVSFGAGVTLPDGQTDGAAVRVGAVTIGNLVAGRSGVAGQDLQILLSADATPALLTTVIGALSYQTTLEDVAASRVLTVSVSDGDGAVSRPALISVEVTPVNDAPAVTLANTVTSLAENADTATRLKVADIVVSDDTIGSNSLALTGSDAAIFEILGSELYLQAGVSLDFETLDQLDVTVTVDDPALGTGTEDSAALTVTITDVNEALDETGTSGPDTFLGTSLDDKFDGLGGNDTATGGEGNDGLNGGDGDDSLDGGPGDDKLPAGAGNDFSFGGEGNDSLGGGDGDDYLDGGAGNDIGGGGPGNDTMIGGEGNDRFNGGFGDDLMDMGAGDDSASGGFGDDTMFGGDGNDQFNGGGNDDLMSMGAGNDTAGGGNGNDTMSGGDGNDYLGGGNGNDSIDGGAGNDTIISGFGNDVVTGGTEADVFIFNNLLGGGTTVITDFEDGIDTIRVTGLRNPADPVGRLNITDVTFEGQQAVEMTYGDHTIIVLNTTEADFSTDDFLFT